MRWRWGLCGTTTHGRDVGGMGCSTTIQRHPATKWTWHMGGEADSIQYQRPKGLETKMMEIRPSRFIIIFSFVLWIYHIYFTICTEYACYTLNKRCTLKLCVHIAYTNSPTLSVVCPNHLQSQKTKPPSARHRSYNPKCITLPTNARKPHVLALPSSTQNTDQFVCKKKMMTSKKKKKCLSHKDPF